MLAQRPLDQESPIHTVSFMKRSTIILCKCDIRLYYSINNITLLEVLEQNKILVEYQCRSGYCGSCRITLHKGAVDYLLTPLAFMQHNEILACCCYPRGDIAIDL